MSLNRTAADSLPAASRSRAGGLPSANRSRITNGNALLPPGADGNSPEYRRLKDVIALLTAELSKDCGALTLADEVRIKQCATLVVRSEALAAAIVSNVDVNDENVVRINNALERTLRSLFSRRKGKKAPPALGDLLKRTEERAR
jgi:hypothetical protein